MLSLISTFSSISYWILVANSTLDLRVCIRPQVRHVHIKTTVYFLYLLLSSVSFCNGNHEVLRWYGRQLCCKLVKIQSDNEVVKSYVLISRHKHNSLKTGRNYIKKKSNLEITLTLFLNSLLNNWHTPDTLKLHRGWIIFRKIKSKGTRHNWRSRRLNLT